MSLVPESVMPHVRRFGFSGNAAGVVVVMMFGINPISVITGQFSPPPPPTSITGVPEPDAELEVLAAYPPIVGGEAALMWERAFRLAAYKYPRISTSVVSDSSGFGCGLSGKDLTVFYCPETQTVYADTAAYDRLRQLHPAGADYAIAYLVAAAYGRHVQWKLAYFEELVGMRTSGVSAEEVERFEQQLDMQAACYAAMWTITAGIEELLDDADVVAAIATVEANRDRAIVDLPDTRVLPEVLTRASPERRKYWYDKGYAIPAPGTCNIRKIAEAGVY